MRKAKVSFLCLSLFASILSVVVAGDSTRRVKAQSEPGSYVDSLGAPASGDGRGFDVSNMDTTVSACENFFQYANGGWVRKNPIPPAYASWGRFNELSDRNQQQLQQILEDAAKSKAAKGTNEQKIGDYYASCMDEAAIETAGLSSLMSEMKPIDAINSKESFQREVAELHSTGVRVLFRFGSAQDFKQSTQVIGQLGQGGLGLPDRDYYTKTDDKSKELRDKYLSHIAKMLALAGDDPATAQARAQTVMTIETKLAEASMTRVEQRNPENIYHKTKIADLKGLAPNFDWVVYFKSIGLQSAGDVNVAQPNFLKSLNDQLTATPLSDWKVYLRWHLLNARASALPKAFAEEDFDFSGRTLTGAKEIQPRWSVVWLQPIALWARRWARFMCRSISPRQPKRVPWRWWET